MKGLVWLRSDLRITDNPALRAACKNHEEVHAVYIFSKNQLISHNESNVKVDFLISNLFLLEENLRELNIPLTVINSSGFKEDPQLIKQLLLDRNINHIYWNAQFGEDEYARDTLTKNLLKKNNIRAESFDDSVIYKPGILKTSQGGAYSVFTPFKRKWIENFDMDFLDIDYSYKRKISPSISSNIDNFNFDFDQSHKVDMSLWPPGEKEADARLKKFLDEKVVNYTKDRNDPILDGTSRISPYLACGIISPKKCILEALKKNNFELSSGESGITKWIDEIVWREFYKNIMFSFPKVSKGQPFQDYSKKIKWRFDKNEFIAWKDGKTGFPIIDAAMRQLMHEGWMHNRLRMVVAMFFTKNMLHDWRLGETYFMQNLIDGDFASNNGGWQWSSSTGTDAAPYFRIFNPITQSTNFDKNGEFIKKYIPELKD
ncbi:MAG: deoxyribodipyrimidine photo-lyase, partial [Flavobacteriaceae bacterium]|nr:deoxyribodipyrimidine photo-lyase [Flavobacteriaceae bacterium]